FVFSNVYGAHQNNLTKNNTEDDKSLNESDVCSHDRLMKEVTHLPFAERCLVQFQLFGSCNNSTMSDECSTKDDDKATTTKAYQAYFSGDKKLLTKYRMSFEVEWHRIEEQLFRLLSQLLIDSSEHLT